MKTTPISSLAIATLLGVTVSHAASIWDGGAGDGQYTSPNNWNPDGLPSNADDAIINTGDTVNFTPGGDFAIIGGSLSVTGGSRWQTSAGNWSQIDGGLALDNGTFIRTAGGVLGIGTRTTGGTSTITVANGSLLEADNLRFGNKNFGATSSSTSISLTSGSSMVARGGELWFGDPNPGNGTYSVDLTINDGSITATGGGGASWFLWGSTHDGGTIGGGTPVGDNSYSVNFTGPGSITLGAAGLNIGTNAAAQSYEDLWNAGILKANGSNSGAFADFFAVTNSPGDANYVLTSTVPEPGAPLLALLGSAGFLMRRRRGHG